MSDAQDADRERSALWRLEALASLSQHRPALAARDVVIGFLGGPGLRAQVLDDLLVDAWLAGRHAQLIAGDARPIPNELRDEMRAFWFEHLFEDDERAAVQRARRRRRPWFLWWLRR